MAFLSDVITKNYDHFPRLVKMVKRPQAIMQNITKTILSFWVLWSVIPLHSPYTLAEPVRASTHSVFVGEFQTEYLEEDLNIEQGAVRSAWASTLKAQDTASEEILRENVGVWAENAYKTILRGNKTILYRIMMCESGGNPKAQNPNSSAKGLFQFIDSTWKENCKGNIFNPNDNYACAERMVLQEDKISHWSASKSCWE